MHSLALHNWFGTEQSMQHHCAKLTMHIIYIINIIILVISIIVKNDKDCKVLGGALFI